MATLPRLPGSIPERVEGRIVGTLLIDRNAPSFMGGVAHVWLEAAAPADAAAERLAEATIEAVCHRRGEAEEIAFAFGQIGAIPADARLRAWIDVEATGAPAEDDLYSTESTRVADVPCRLRVERISP